jgi:hypothetical protein
LVAVCRVSEEAIWAAWPCLAIGGVSSLLPNIQMTLATPSFKNTFMSLLSGSLGAGGACGLAIKLIMDYYRMKLGDVFLIWFSVYLVLAIIKLVFWTPNKMPNDILTNDEFSLFQNSGNE